MKLDLSDKTKHLTDQEKDFLDYLVGGVKLSPAELHALYGDDYNRLSNRLELHRLAAEYKRDKSKRKSLVDDFKLSEFTKLIPVAIKTLYEVMQTGKEHNRVAAASIIAKMPLSYLEKHGGKMADIEAILNLDEKSKEIIIKIDAQDAKL